MSWSPHLLFWGWTLSRTKNYFDCFSLWSDTEKGPQTDIWSVLIFWEHFHVDESQAYKFWSCLLCSKSPLLSTYSQVDVSLKVYSLPVFGSSKLPAKKRRPWHTSPSQCISASWLCDTPLRPQAWCQIPWVHLRGLRWDFSPCPALKCRGGQRSWDHLISGATNNVLAYNPLCSFPNR